MKTTIKRFTAGTFIVLLLMAVYVKVDGAEINALRIDSVESGVYVEKWITEEMISNPDFLEFADVVQETNLELEDWMLNDGAYNFEFNYVEEADMDLELEDWMINEDFGNTNVILEPKLRVESWMLNTDFKK